MSLVFGSVAFAEDKKADAGTTTTTKKAKKTKKTKKTGDAASTTPTK